MLLNGVATHTFSAQRSKEDVDLDMIYNNYEIMIHSSKPIITPLLALVYGNPPLPSEFAEEPPITFPQNVRVLYHTHSTSSYFPPLYIFRREAFSLWHKESRSSEDLYLLVVTGEFG